MSATGTKYLVKDGDCISSIACKFGFFWQTIWSDAANAGLRDKRTDPHILQAGDVLVIPEKKIREESCATDAHHRFRRKGVPSVLRMVVMDCDEPLRNQPYVLSVDGKDLRGTTDGDGKLEQPIPPNAKQALLIVGEGDERVEYEIDLGTIDPITTVTGVQARLGNLGFKLGPIDGVIGEETWRAIKSFCFEQGIDLPPKGTIDDTLRNKLKTVHGF